jgi:hypothetical protein
VQSTPPFAFFLLPDPHRRSRTTPYAMSAQETPPKIAYAIFDMDGLLIDTETIYTSVTQEILKRFDLQMSMETKSGLMGMRS